MDKKSITQIKKSFCLHPIPEKSVQEVLENIVNSAFDCTTKQDPYNIKNKELLLHDLISFYNCPVCRRWSKIESIKEIIYKVIKVDENSILPVFNKELYALEIYVPFLINLRPNEKLPLELGYKIELPEQHKINFYCSEDYLLSGLMVFCPMITSNYKREITLYLHNNTDSFITISRTIPIGYFSVDKNASSSVVQLNISE